MNEDYSVLSALRSLAIFTAFAFAFYFLLVWNPVGTLGDIRNYLEHRVRVPVEWIVLAFPVAWMIQRTSGYTSAAAVLVPIFVVILTFTKPDYGAEFWRIFRDEVYLDPVYVPRGLLVCFFLLSVVVLSRLRWNDRGTLLLCLIIGFALTSWEALITPAPPRTSEEGGSMQFLGQWAEVIQAGWNTISWYIVRYVPPDYQNAARIGLSLYPFLAAFLLLFPSYRKYPRDFVRDHQAEFPIYLSVGIFLGLSGWALWAATSGSALGGGAKFVLAILGIPAVLMLLFLVVTSIFWIPAGLFILPAWLFWVASQPFKVVYVLVVKAPFMVLHYLHYLMVPHPVEEVIKKYEEVRARGVPIDHRSFAEKMAHARYNRIREGIPAWWKSKNWEKRLKALRGRVHSEKDVADKYTEEFRKDHRQ